MNVTLVKQSTKILSFVSSGMLILAAIIDLPEAYYFFLRILVFASALWVIFRRLDKKAHWVVLFALVATLYNPFMPIDFNLETLWIIMYLITAIMFIAEYNSYKKKYVHTER
ncbi:DUF6804 family protein [Ascidiimonas aurantiaca]|uniref:DUF6804 family protein n=1 Tax=Ascidiimonas aurantiaca TaxID=1685432 RepID=UPI0030EC9036